jgi:molybdopterin molybdotransferase
MSEPLKNKKRTTVIPGDFDGEYFTPSKKRAPGMVNVLSNANSMIVVDENNDELLENDEVKILPINWKFFTDIKKDFITK